MHAPLWLVAPALVLALTLGFGGGYLAALRTTAPCPLGGDVCAGLDNFWKAWNLASENYVDPQAVDSTRMTDGAISGMLDSLGDQGHTRYLSPETARAERESLAGRFEGIGIYIDIRDSQPLVVQPIEGSPAEAAGLRAGDLILKVDGVDVRGTTLDDLRSRVRGPAGTPVTLTVLHEGESGPVDVTVTRGEITIPAVSWRMLANQVALIRLNQFSGPSSEQMEQALTEAQTQGAEAMVLDLRNNPGGRVSELVEIASQFLPKDTVVLLEQDREGARTPYKTRDGGVAQAIPLVVLVNDNTASSAEILAGALSEHGRARVIGTPTYGTATVLRPFELDGGAQLYIGTSQWLTPNGEVVRGKGIQPDDLVALPDDVQPLSPSEAAKLSAAELETTPDIQLAHAIGVLAELAQR